MSIRKLNEWLSFFFLSGFLASGCTTPTQKVDASNDASTTRNYAYEKALRSAVAEISVETKEADHFAALSGSPNDRGNLRSPATARSDSDNAKALLAQGFAKLKLTGGNAKFAEVLVYPKRSDITDRNRTTVEKDYGDAQPLTYILELAVEPGSSMALKGKCSWAQRLQNQRFNSQKYFGPYDFTNGNADLECAGVRVYLTDSPLARQAAQHRDTVTEFDLYIDSYYRGYGSDFVITNGAKDIAKLGATSLYNVPLMPRSRSVSSGITLFPADIPSLAAVTMIARAGKLWIPDDKYVQSNLKAQAVSSCDQAYIFEYKDHFGMKTKVGWCVGDAWPTVIENNRFYAILKKGVAQ